MGRKEEPTALSLAAAAEMRGEIASSDLTRPDVIRTSGLSPSNYDRIVKGTKVPSLAEFAAIAEGLRLDGAVLLKRAMDRAAKMPQPKTNAQKAQDYRDRTHPPESGEHPRREDLA